MKAIDADFILSQILNSQSIQSPKARELLYFQIATDLAFSLERIAESLELENKRLSMKPDFYSLMQNLISLLTGFIVVGKEENSENADFTPPKREATF